MGSDMSYAQLLLQEWEGIFKVMAPFSSPEKKDGQSVVSEAAKGSCFIS